MAKKRRSRIAGRIAWKEGYKTKKGTRYIVRYRDEQGAKVDYKGGLTEDEAIAAIDAIEEARERTVPRRVPGQARDLADLLEDYLTTSLADGHMGAANADNIRRGVQIFCQTHKDPEGLDSRITREKAPSFYTCRDLTIECVDAWRNGPHGKDWIYTTLKGFMRWCARYRKQAVDATWLMRDRARVRSRGNNASTEPDLLEDSTVERIYRQMAAAGPNVELLAHMLITYGKRPITCLHMLHQDWDLDGQRLFIRHVKRKQPYWHMIHPHTVELARKVIDPDLSALPPPTTADTALHDGDRCFTDPRTGRPWELPRDAADQLVAWYRWHVGHALKLGAPQIIRHRVVTDENGKRLRDDDKKYIREPVVQYCGGGLAGIYALKDWAITQLIQQHERDPDSMPLDDIYKFTGTRSLDRYRKTNEKRQQRSLNSMRIIGANLEAG